jgi:hypothetical protein
MKYQISEHITIQTIDNETIKDIVFHELTEQEFLVHYLKDPNLSYWKIDGDTKYHYKNNKLIATVKDGKAISYR